VRLAARTITLSLLVFLSIAASADTLSGKVVKVADGDSITVLDNTNTQHRIRLVLAAVAIGFRFRNLSL
jgi:endonuclease YncB( thermonuclease family)